MNIFSARESTEIRKVPWNLISIFTENEVVGLENYEKIVEEINEESDGKDVEIKLI